jgi:phage terminase Nu1 subunit (DNA packaging protein)
MSTILQNLLNQAGPIIASGVAGSLVFLSKKAGDELKVLIPSLQQNLENKAGAQKTAQIESEAQKIWNIVDENFRITQFVGDTIKAKQDMFNKKLLDKFPELTQAEIDDVRQAIAGAANQGKASIVNTINTITITQEELTALQVKANMYDQIQNTITTSATPVNK